MQVWRQICHQWVRQCSWSTKAWMMLWWPSEHAWIGERDWYSERYSLALYTSPGMKKASERGGFFAALRWILAFVWYHLLSDFVALQASWNYLFWHLMFNWGDWFADTDVVKGSFDFQRYICPLYDPYFWLLINEYKTCGSAIIWYATTKHEPQCQLQVSLRLANHCRHGID